MKFLLILVVLIGIVVGGLHFFPSLASKAKIALPNIPQLHLAKSEDKDTPEKTALQGKVAGIATTAQSAFQSASTLFLSTPGPGSDNINVGTVVNQISKQVENIPSQLLGIAKVQYCQQVLIEATKSAEKKIE
ncbi:MAG: hypothetical protein ABI758_03760 [Candidatus Woesebacteria bacterium]